MVEIATDNHKDTDLENRYLIALVNDRKIAFPACWVREILLLQRSQVLKLPFYDRAVLGVVDYQNQIVPLVSGRTIFLKETKKISQTTFTAVRLNESAEQLAGVGIIVDRMIANLSKRELNSEQLFQLTDISPKIWQPLY